MGNELKPRTDSESFPISNRIEGTAKTAGAVDTVNAVRAESRVHPALRVILLLAGTLCVAIGAVGIFLPVLPTTPFILLAAACYARSSDRMYRWLVSHPRFGRSMQAFLEKGGLPRRVKTVALVCGWMALGGMALFVVESHLGKALLIALALVKTGVLVRIPTVVSDSDE